MLILEATDDGRESLRPPNTFSPGRAPGTGGAGGAPGGRGAAARGGFGTELRDVSGSERYGAPPVSAAPVLTPPDFLSFGMPPANSPPSCGGAATAPSPPVSLLLRARFPPGTGGASPPGGAGGRPRPGTGGAPPIAGALGPLLTLPTSGEERSLTWATFFSRAPLVMSPSRAPCGRLAAAPRRVGAHGTHSSCARRRLPSGRLHAGHGRRRRRPSSAPSHGRHGRRGRRRRHGVESPTGGVFLLFRGPCRACVPCVCQFARRRAASVV